MAVSSTFVRALKQQTTTIPIIMAVTADAVRNGLVSNLARPEGNVTGVAWFGYELLPKRIELLKEIVPQLRRLAIIDTSIDPIRREIVDERITIGARRLGFGWKRFRPVANNYDDTFDRLAAEHFDAACILGDLLGNEPQSKTRKNARHHTVGDRFLGKFWRLLGGRNRGGRISPLYTYLAAFAHVSSWHRADRSWRCSNFVSCALVRCCDRSQPLVAQGRLLIPVREKADSEGLRRFESDEVDS